MQKPMAGVARALVARAAWKRASSASPSPGTAASERGILPGDVSAFLDVSGDRFQAVPLVGSTAS